MTTALDLGPTPYSDLGVEYNATKEQIDAALARSNVHIIVDPFDGFPTDEAHERIQIIGDAMDVLGDSQFKGLYDAYLRRVHGVKDFEYPTCQAILQVDKDATEEEVNANYEHFMRLWVDGRYERVPAMALGQARDRMVAKARKARKDSATTIAKTEHAQTTALALAGPSQAAPIATTEPTQPTAQQATTAPKMPKKVKDPNAPKVPNAPKKIKDPSTSKNKAGTAPKQPKVPKPVKVTKPQKAKSQKSTKKAAGLPKSAEGGPAPKAEPAVEDQNRGDTQQAMNGQNAPVAVMAAQV